MAMDAFGSEHAVSAVHQILQPLAKLMITHSVQLGDATEMLKQALVDAAIQAHSGQDHAITDSRIAILTGVHRKDIRRLRQDDAPKVSAAVAAPMLSIGAQVVARWISEPRYLDARNKARPLARTPRHAKAGEPDFTTLVAEVSRDVGARAVLDELLRLGIIENMDDTHVQLQSDAFVPQDGISESFHYLATNVSDHLATAVHNLQPGRSALAMLEQSAFSSNLSSEDAAELEQTARMLWSQALKQFLQKATAAEERSSKKTTATQRVRYGVYFHQAAMPDLPASKSPHAARKAAPRKLKP